MRVGTATLALALSTLACQAEKPIERALERPNVVLILSDDQRADAVGAYGNPYIRTPTLDGLAGRGFSFRGAHIMGSHHGAVCAPSRAMLMSGRTLFRVYDDLEKDLAAGETTRLAFFRLFTYALSVGATALILVSAVLILRRSSSKPTP